MASPSPFQWATHKPEPSASAHTRLRCMLLDLLASSPLPKWPIPVPTSSNSPDSSLTPEAPFAPLATSGLADTDGPFFIPQLDKHKYCWDMDLVTSLPTILPIYEFDSAMAAKIAPIVFPISTRVEVVQDKNWMRQQYVIEAEAHAKEENHAFVTAFDGKSGFGPVVASVSVKWLKPTEEEAAMIPGGDPAPGLRWPIIQAILKHHAEIRYGIDGVETDEKTYREKTEMMQDRLTGEFGYAGWPGRVTRPEDAFRKLY